MCASDQPAWYYPANMKQMYHKLQCDSVSLSVLTV